jgi:hypothetical protein
MLVNNLLWTDNDNSFYINYEHKKKNISGIKNIQLNYDNSEEYHSFGCIDITFNNTKIKELDISINNSEVLIISGNFPMIYNTNTCENIQLFDIKDMTKQKRLEKFTFIIKELEEKDTYIMIIKELYLILLLKDADEASAAKKNNLMENLFNKNLSSQQCDIFFELTDVFNTQFNIVDLYSVNLNNGDISNIVLNKKRNTLVINSSDKTLRLFNFVMDKIIFVRDYVDSVNKKKWLNAYFYTFKLKSNIQDLILTASADSHSIEFIFIDMTTGKFTKKIDLIKYQCNDFVAHYENNFNILMTSGRKIYSLPGYPVTNWGTFAPQLKYIEENIEFIEEEEYYDKFNRFLKKKHVQRQNDNKPDLKNIFKGKYQNKSNSKFFKYSPIEDNLSLQSEKDLQELFNHMNEVLET